MKLIPTPERTVLRSLFDYRAETGQLIWRFRTWLSPRAAGWNTRYAGTVAGTPDKDGYLTIRIDGQAHKASRLVWAWVYGKQPVNEIDHRDLDKANNRIGNLRDATHLENRHNRDGNKLKKLPCGVSRRCDGKKWVAKIVTEGRYQHLGSFNSVEEASAAYRHAAVVQRGNFARTV